MHVLNDNKGSRTMRSVGRQGKKRLFILIDSGSTRNFLSENTTQRLRCKLQLVEGVSVTVANGQNLQCA